jgi:hypothetical protein
MPTFIAIPYPSRRIHRIGEEARARTIDYGCSRVCGALNRGNGKELGFGERVRAVREEG